MYKTIKFDTCIGLVEMRPIIASNLFTVLDSRKLYPACVDELESRLLFALSECKYIKRMNRSDCVRVSTYFGAMILEYKAALLLYRALKYMDATIIDKFCDNILDGVSNFYRESGNMIGK